MKFIKRNWFKIILAVLLLVAAIFAIIASVDAFCAAGKLGAEVTPGTTVNDVITAGDPSFLPHTKNGLTGRGLIYLGVALSCVFIIAFFVLKIILSNKKAATFVFVGSTLVVIAIFIVGIIISSGYLGDLSNLIKAFNAADNPLTNFQLAAAKTNYTAQIAQTITFLVAFGFVPLAFGIKKLFHKHKAEVK